MKIANWKKVGVIIAGLTLLVALKNAVIKPQDKVSGVGKDNKQSVGNITTGDHSPVNVIQQISVKIENIDDEKARQLEAQLKNLQAYQYPFPDRPKIGVVEPYVTFVNFVDNPPQFRGLVKAGINIPLLNVGGVTAKNVVTKWKILDNGIPRTSASDYFGYDPYLIDELLPNTAIKLYYNPDIGASGTGTFEIVLEIEYINANTGEKYTEQFKGITNYSTQKDNKPVTRVLTRQ